MSAAGAVELLLYVLVILVIVYVIVQVVRRI